MFQQSLYEPQGQSFLEMSKEGCILIPDITGFTKFVSSTDVITGRNITYELLATIVEANNLELKISEVEGDAILFYKYGTPPSVRELLKQFERMQAAFDNKVREINRRFDFQLELSLKMIAHYGSIAEYNIGGFAKLYGESIIIAHRLLKNSIPVHCYALFTSDLMNASASRYKESFPHCVNANNTCEIYGEFRNICYTWFDYEAITSAV